MARRRRASNADSPRAYHYWATPKADGTPAVYLRKERDPAVDPAVRTIDFQVDLHNGTNGPDGVIGSGSAGGDIKPGATIDVTVMVNPTKFAD